MIDEARIKNLELVPIDCTLKMCTLEEKNSYITDNRHSKVFDRNLKLLNQALTEYPNKSVTFCGRNLYIVPSEKHNEIKKKVKESVEKHRRKKKDEKVKSVEEENEKLTREIQNILSEDLQKDSE